MRHDIALGVVFAAAMMVAIPASAQTRGRRSHRAKTTMFQLLPPAVLRRAASPPMLALPVGPRSLILPQARPELSLQASYYDEHANRVRRDLMFFAPATLGLDPILENGPLRGDGVNHMLLFSAPPRVEDSLTLARDLDRLMLFRDKPTQNGAGIAAGVSMFAATALSAAHAPRKLRLFFDEPVHLGPAIFQGGGMGAGIGGEIH